MNKLNTYTLLVVSLALVYVAFGIPKILGISSVNNLIQASFPFFNLTVIGLLGLAEIIIGITLIYKKTRSFAAIAVMLHLLGTFSAIILNFGYFFNSKTIFSLEGEFVFKNIVFIATALYILSVENNIKAIKFLNKTDESKKN
jgi:uncharacterized membrane protein YkgB